ncbi:keratin, type I cuticular Ha6-like [Mixophyes fleayi]|uniref:keratin, type I cuticular Ha6-like n=1 Tax=Mixophyes fleayi TaxID=3061075 RepID=UPI003F4E2B7C
MRSLIEVCHSGGHYPKASSHNYSLHHGSLHKFHNKCSSVLHHGGHYKAPSVHGCSKASFSTHSSSGHGHGSLHGGHKHGSHVTVSHHGWKNTGLLSINEKETLQHLNQRLSSYLEKVHSLEQENAQLEREISGWYENNAPSTLPDSSQYLRSIQELQNMIFLTTSENARTERQIDNAQQRATDLRNRYQSEVSLINNAETEISSLSRALDEFNMGIQDLERQDQCLQEELLQLKNSHVEEVNSLQAQLGARVDVELDAAPSVDLQSVLSEIREEYENLMQRNLREVEDMFRTRASDLNQDVSFSEEQLQSFNNEIIDLKFTVQTLEIELQSQMSLIASLESTISETAASFGSQLAQLQCLIDNVQAQLAQIRSDLEQQNHEYQRLMDQKTYLEMEIATYKHLIEGHNIQYVN